MDELRTTAAIQSQLDRLAGVDGAAVGSVTRRLLDDEREVFELVRVQGVTH
jgi:hypothetical protein